MLGLIASSLNIEYLIADILEESRNPATEAYRAAYVANSSNSTPNSNSNPSKKGKNKKKGKKKASYNVKGQNYSAKSAEQASFILGSYNLAIEEEEESDSSSNSSSSSDSNTQLAQLLALKGYKKRKDFKGKGLKTSSNNKAKYKDNQPRRRPRDPAFYNSQLHPINTGNGPISPAGIGSITLEVLSRKVPPTYTKLVLDNVLYLPNININIVSRVRHYNSGGCLIKETLYRGDRRCIAVLDFKKSGFFLDVKVEIPSDSIRKEDDRPIIEDAIVSEAIEPKKRYKLRNSPAKGTTLEEECKLLVVLGSKTYLVYILSRRAVLKTSTIKFIEDNTVLSQPTDNTALEGELVDLDLDLEGAVSPDPSNLNTEKPISIEIGPSKLEPYESSSNILKLPRDKRSKWLEAITKEFIQLLELRVFKFLPRSLLPSNCKLITYRNVLKVKKDAKNRPIKYKSREEIYMEIPKGLLDLAASNKAIYKLLLQYGYNPSTPNIIKLSKALYSLKQSPREWQDKLKILLKSLGFLPLISDLGVFYNAKTCYFIVTYIDNYLSIGPDIGYMTDLKKQLNKVYAIEDLGPAAYFLGVQIIRDRPNRHLWLNQPTKSYLNAAKNLFKYLNSTKDYGICFSYNRNTVADLGPKLSNSSNITTKLSRDFHSKEGPRPLTTTSTTIVDSRNGKGSSQTSIINSSLVPIGFSDSDFAGDKAPSKSTYGYLYKLAEAIREVQWIIGLFSELYRPIDHLITLYIDN
ncbi:hypothetical protein P8C59_008628 [Phyllachora maydis]|uniref:Reverse transcriptase Ty1/copia-type domain-containing protein n=1 Tax=Phyllachora maydis TaxID=1825666 RepID=A0AAD9IC60_9PEZI|nr:hypothetical protein P8C59_008628 [Phyllachora maydis]